MEKLASGLYTGNLSSNITLIQSLDTVSVGRVDKVPIVDLWVCHAIGEPLRRAIRAPHPHPCPQQLSSAQAA